jgi:hypothetical protein
MTTILSHVAHDDIDYILIEVAEDYLPGYGYGNTGLDFFNVYGVDGDNQGYIDTVVGPTGTYGYDYGTGFELSEIIGGINRSKTITVSVLLKEANTKSYNLRIRIRGNGKSSIHAGTATSSGSSDIKTLDFVVSPNDNQEELSFFTTDNYVGTLLTEDKDSFFDVVVESIDGINQIPEIPTKGTVDNTNTLVSITVKVKSTVE